MSKRKLIWHAAGLHSLEDATTDRGFPARSVPLYFSGYCMDADSLILCSTQQGETRKRGERAEDSKRSHVQSPGMNAPKTYHRSRCRVRVPRQYTCSSKIKAQASLLFKSLVSMLGFVVPRTLKVLVIGAFPEALPSRLRPQFRFPIFVFQARTELDTRLRLVHRRKPQL